MSKFEVGQVVRVKQSASRKPASMGSHLNRLGGKGVKCGGKGLKTATVRAVRITHSEREEYVEILEILRPTRLELMEGKRPSAIVVCDDGSIRTLRLTSLEALPKEA